MNQYASSIFRLSISPEEVSTKHLLFSSVLLVFLLNFSAPLVTVLTPIPLLGSVVFVAIIYGIFTLVTESVFESLISGAFVLVTYSADVPLIASTGNASFGPILADFVIVPFTCLLVYWERSELSSEKSGKYVVTALATFVLWSFLSAFISNGPSPITSFAFALSATRYLIYFIFACLLIQHISIFDGIYPLLIAISGHIAIAILEAYSGSAYGFTQLGDATGNHIGKFEVFVVEFTSGLFAGGFAGTSRVLVSVLLLVAPSVVAISAVQRRSRLSRLVPLALFPFIAIMVRISETDSGLGAVVLVFSLLVIFTGYQSIVNKRSEFQFSFFTTIVSLAFTIVLFNLNNQSAPETSSGVKQKGTNVSPTGSQESILQLVQSIPGLNSDTLLIRLQQYSTAIDVGMQFPLFGIGGWNFEIISQAYGFDKQQVIHNTYLAYFAELGFPGIFSFLIAILLPFVFAVSLARKSNINEAIIWWSLVFGLLSFHAFAFWTSIYYNAVSYGVLWLVNGLIVGSWYQRKNPPRQEVVPFASAE